MDERIDNMIKMFGVDDRDRMLAICEAADSLGRLFDPINEQVCSGCCNQPGGGCCGGCGSAYGHFRRGWGAPKIPRKFKRKYKFSRSERGPGYFDRELKRCRLPRELRSITCLVYTCHRMTFTEEQRILFNTGIKKIREARGEDIPI